MTTPEEERDPWLENLDIEEEREIWLEKRGVGFFPHYRVTTQRPVHAGGGYLLAGMLVALLSVFSLTAALWVGIGLLVLWALLS